MALKGQNVLVLGASGVIGSGAVHNFLAQGAKVVVVSRTQEKLGKLLESFPDAKNQLVGVVGHYTKKSDVEEVYAKVKHALNGASPDHVVSSLGFATVTPTGILDAEFKSLPDSFEESLYPSILAAQVILKDIKDKEGATYTVVSGGLAHNCFWPGAWAATIKNAAMNGFILSLASDTSSSKVRVNGACLHYSVALPGEKANQMGMPPAQNSVEFGRVFTRFVEMKDVKGQVVCFSDKAFSEKF